MHPPPTKKDYKKGKKKKKKREKKRTKDKKPKTTTEQNKKLNKTKLPIQLNRTKQLVLPMSECRHTQTQIVYTDTYVKPVVQHWLEQVVALWVQPICRPCGFGV